MSGLLEYKLAEASAARNAVFAGLKRNRPLSKDYEKVGLLGEWEFGRFCGLMPGMQPGGDGGYDFRIPVTFTVDVKTSRKADYLLVEVGKVKADIYVLAHYVPQEEVDFSSREVWETGKAELVGWAWATTVERQEPKDTGRGIINHALPREQLRPMADLGRMINRVQ